MDDKKDDPLLDEKFDMVSSLGLESKEERQIIIAKSREDGEQTTWEDLCRHCSPSTS